MGNSYVNHQVRAESVDPVVAMARRVCCGPAYVAPTGEGWVGVFDEGVESAGNPMMHQLALDLSAGLETTVFAFSVFDSDVLIYFPSSDTTNILSTPEPSTLAVALGAVAFIG